MASDNPTLPAGCEEYPAPTVLFDDCTPDIGTGGFGWLIVSQNPFAAAPSTAEVATRLAITSATDPDKFTILTLNQGGMAPVDPALITYGNEQVAAGPVDRQITVQLLETNSTNVEFARLTQAAGGYRGRFWLVTLDGQYMRGGQNGVKGRLNLGSTVPTDGTTQRSIDGAVNYRNKVEPKQGPNVFPVGPDADE